MSVWWAAAGAAVGIVVGAVVIGVILRTGRSSLLPVSEQWLAQHKRDPT